MKKSMPPQPKATWRSCCGYPPDIRPCGFGKSFIRQKARPRFTGSDSIAPSGIACSSGASANPRPGTGERARASLLGLGFLVRIAVRCTIYVYVLGKRTACLGAEREQFHHQLVL